MKAMSQAKARAIVAERAGGVCEVGIASVCQGRSAGLHHRRKRSAGGLWAPSNLLAACGDGTTGCHGWIEGHPKNARAKGWWIFTGDGAPDAVPLVMHANAMSRWWLLADDGSISPHLRPHSARPPDGLGSPS